MKYVDTAITFAEIPDEITLCINISNCPCHCKGCHSPYLADDIGEELTQKSLLELVRNNLGVTCVSFMGGDSNPQEVVNLAFGLKFISWTYVKVAWYSGRQELPEGIDLRPFDYIKLGPYIEELGPINVPTTNQRLYKVENGTLHDITEKFWKSNVEQ